MVQIKRKRGRPRKTASISQQALQQTTGQPISQQGNADRVKLFENILKREAEAAEAGETKGAAR